MAKAQQKSEVLVLVGGNNGVVVVPQPTLLTRLHYFDGKLLRADDLKKEQDYLRSLVHLSNQAGGFGVVHGFDIALSSAGNALLVGPGMAIDPNGRVLLLPVSGTQLGVDDLIQKSQATGAQGAGNGSTSASASAGSFVNCLPSAAATPSPDHTPRDASLYLITVGFAEAHCGQDDVFGKLCEEACAGSTDRPFTVEGLVFRAIPLILQTPLATSTEVTLGPEHRRSLVASAYFADERAALPHLISGAGLRSQTWCKGALLFCGNDVALGVLSRSGSQTQFLDAWIARRERIEDAPRRYWAMRMAMRPWNVFLAQILQFQCQLADLLKGQDGAGTPDDPCSTALNTAADMLASVKQAIGEVGGDAAAAIKALETFLSQAKTDVASLPGDRMLIEGGIVELPPAGYLPVSPTALATVNEQVRKMVGEGLDLRFCVVRPDFVHHALEEAQHMDRISLLQGLDNPGDKPQVDILVPDGEIASLLSSKDLLLFRTKIAINKNMFGGGGDNGNNNNNNGGDNNGGAGVDDSGAPTGNGTTFDTDSFIDVQGASRIEPLIGRGAAFHAAGIARFPMTGSSSGPAPSASAPAPGGSSSGSMASEISGGYNGGAGNLYGSSAYVSTKTSSSTSASGWLTARAESNPFTSKYGDVVPLSASLIITVTSGPNVALVKLNGGGNLQVLAVSHTSSTEWGLSAKVDVWASFESTGSNGQSSKDGAQASVLVNATFTGAAGAGELLATLSSPDPNDDFDATIKVKWGGTPITVSASLVGGSDNPTEAVKVKLLHDPDILDPANAWHGIALQAVSAIGVALKDALFADNAENLLFPSPETNETGLVVRAVRDWVLFHRRRNKRCSVDVVRPALPPKRYQVFVVNMEELGESPPTAKEIQQAFAGNNEEQLDYLRSKCKAVTIVEYAGGKATLLTQEPTVKSAWQAQVSGGNKIALGLIATKGEDDVEILEVARVDRVEQVVSSLTPLADGAESLSVSDVPSNFDTPATDGFILYGLVEEVVTECQSAFVMELPQGHWNDPSFDPLLLQTNYIFLDLGTQNASVASAYLGSVDFEPNDVAVAGGDNFAQQYQAWTNGMQNDVQVVFCDAFAKGGNGPDVNVFPHRQRALAIAQTIDQGAVTATTTATIKGPPSQTKCPVAAILAAVPVYADVVVVNTTVGPEPLRFQYLEANLFPPSSAVTNLVTKLRFKGDQPLPQDIHAIAVELGFTSLSMLPTPYLYVAMTQMATDPANNRLTNVTNALQGKGVVATSSADPISFIVNHATPFTDPVFKTMRSRYVIFLFRVVQTP